MGLTILIGSGYISITQADLQQLLQQFAAARGRAAVLDERVEGDDEQAGGETDQRDEHGHAGQSGRGQAEGGAGGGQPDRAQRHDAELDVAAGEGAGGDRAQADAHDPCPTHRAGWQPRRWFPFESSKIGRQSMYVADVVDEPGTMIG